MQLFSMKKLFHFAMFLNSTLLAAFGLLQFISEDKSVEFTVTGIALRIIQGIGVSGVFTTGQTYIAEVFDKNTLFVMVCKCSVNR